MSELRKCPHYIDDGSCTANSCYYQSDIGNCSNPAIQKKPTNADRIRAMSDEELAKQLYSVFVDGMNAIKLIDKNDLQVAIKKSDYRDWLRSEAKEE